MATTIDVTGLVKKLTQYKDAYYNGSPLVTDAQYDALEDELRRIDPQHPYFAKVGAPLPQGGAFPEVKHTTPMVSLNKVQVLTELSAWFKSCALSAADHVMAMDKMDGASLSLKYLKRRLVQVLTRGDGVTGQDVTRNALLMKGAVKMLPPTFADGTPVPDVVFVRGEVMCFLSDFTKHFPGESSPRSTANGTIKRQTGFDKCQFLTFVAYRCMPNGQSMTTKSGELASLVSFGFTLPKNARVAADPAQIEAIYQSYIAGVRKGLDYEIDGIVVEIDDATKREDLGDLNGNPKGACAYKFAHETRETILRTIEWQIGNSGRITPVAIFDEASFGGVKVGRASLAGVRQVEYLKLFPGCRILVARRNDVIPRVEANLDMGIVNDL